ncbi:acid-sensing ion channel 2-like [Rhipicephalus sanguineus]|uniref:acid-sensing ion channel 2-like n=1 Tax=Rhipicephalus sanguineus TaxID=34632 RepID=UPI0020C385BC|nr:acid-sensing ion channel 2-like [Rhipicephalus sanguineus]
MPSSVNGGEASRDSLWRTCGQVYGELATDAGLPGAEALVKGGVLRRLLWTGALLTLVYYSASEMCATFSEYFAYSVAIAFEYNTNESFQMPDVTVCNLNPLRRSRYCALHASERVMNTELNRRICGKKWDFKEANLGDLRLQQHIWDWLSYHKAKNRAWLRTLGHQFADTFVNCSYHGWDCRDATLYRNVTDLMYNNCFCFLCDHKPRVDYTTMSSPYDGLVVTLNPQLNEYLPTSYQAGFIAMVHLHGTRYSICEDGVFLTPGHTTYVGLNLLAQTGLPEPYANPCQSTWPPRLMVHMDQMYGVYTREDCLVMCLQVKVVEACECLLVYLPQIFTLAQRYDTCADKKLECAMHVSKSQTPYMLEQECNCIRACKPPARLVVYFKSLTYDHTLSVPKYDETNVLGNLGGIIGMYLGLSFLIIFQVLDVLVVGTLRLWKMLR